MRLRFACLILLGACCAGEARAQDLTFRGEAAAAVTVNDVEPRSTYLSARYVPELFGGVALGRTTTLDALAVVDATATSRVIAPDTIESESELDLYRLWLRCGGSQFETRIGLQKIAFGSATLLRPLMWFDRLDPRDPLQITEGVYGLLARYYFLNNGNIWLWGLLGNDETKGWEQVPSTSDDPEFGGRLQLPAGAGEIALSYHQRRAATAVLMPPGVPVAEESARERRIALDGKWDATIGLWFEAVLVHQDTELRERTYTRLAVAGLDYTFDVGDGLTLLGEHFLADTAEEAFGSGDGSGISAVSARYRWGVIDEISAILNYDWQQDLLFTYATWRRTYDHWAFNLIAFNNPGTSSFSPVSAEEGPRSGTGLQLLVTFNH
jgi:hypothetical protein